LQFTKFYTHYILHYPHGKGPGCGNDNDDDDVRCPRIQYQVEVQIKVLLTCSPHFANLHYYLGKGQKAFQILTEVLLPPTTSKALTPCELTEPVSLSLLLLHTGYPSKNGQPVEL
jgi:hypothetical protein